MEHDVQRVARRTKVQALGQNAADLNNYGNWPEAILRTRKSIQERCSSSTRRVNLDGEISARAARSLLMVVLPFIVWGLHSLGAVVNRMRGTPSINGAAVYNWLSLAWLFVVGLANGPQQFGSLVAMFSISWVVGWRLSKSYKNRHKPKSDVDTATVARD
jgi:hypothetical protein